MYTFHNANKIYNLEHALYECIRYVIYTTYLIESLPNTLYTYIFTYVFFNQYTCIVHVHRVYMHGCTCISPGTFIMLKCLYWLTFFYSTVKFSNSILIIHLVQFNSLFNECSMSINIMVNKLELRIKP